MYIYKSFETQREDKDLGAYRAYGICVLRGGAVVASVPDVGTDEGAVSALAGLCNRLALAPVHLPDVIEDFLAM